jgi:SAM-dependent methyltransferase
MPIQGFLDVCNADIITGWAWDSETDKPVYVDVYDGDVLLVRLLARGFRRDLKDAKIGDGRHAFELLIPRTLRDRQEHRISVRVCDGVEKAFELPGSPQSVYWPVIRNPELAPLLRSFNTRFPWQIDESNFEHGHITVRGRLLAREPLDTVSIYLNGAPFEQLDFLEERDEDPFWYRDDGRFLAFTATSRFNPESLFANKRATVEYVDAVSGRPLYEYHTIYLHPDLCGAPLLPGEDGIRRVTGTYRTDLFLIEGYTTYAKLEDALRHTTGLDFSHAGNILDWGCGCGRLTRYFVKEAIPNVYGVDIDSVNVEWCHRNLAGATFQAVPLRPPMAFPSQYFDLVLGVSVFSHLDEATQLLWLDELQRVCAPGATLMLTYHGEASVARLNLNLSRKTLNNWMTHGFDSSIIDQALHNVISDPAYYRASFHSTEYIKSKWSKYFSIIAMYDGFVSNHQDLVILRKR